MGEQIIQQPDGKLAVFSSIVDDFIVLDATPPELMEWRAKRAADEERERTRAEIGRVLVRDANHPRPAPYYQFTLTWAEAVRKAGHNPLEEHEHDFETVSSWAGRPNGEIHRWVRCSCGEKKEVAEDPTAECACGTMWPDGVLGKGHGDMECEGDG
jgi:hypothetical protein